MTNKNKNRSPPPSPFFLGAHSGAQPQVRALRFVPQLACSHARSSYRRLQLSTAYKNKQRTGIPLCLAGILLSLLLQLLPKLKLYFIDIPIFTYCNNAAVILMHDFFFNIRKRFYSSQTPRSRLNLFSFIAFLTLSGIKGFFGGL